MNWKIFCFGERKQMLERTDTIQEESGITHVEADTIQEELVTIHVEPDTI